jgi:hypothetical protein
LQNWPMRAVTRRSPTALANTVSAGPRTHDDGRPPASAELRQASGTTNEYARQRISMRIRNTLNSAEPVAPGQVALGAEAGSGGLRRRGLAGGCGAGGVR